ncbi:MAG: preprotein translocase subunit YajC [Clostridium sp.]|uniref:preprotein translocase subunit YajC n=1 Tax=Clostridium sp. TaxID=1506 RepID=UPI003D6CF46D
MGQFGGLIFMAVMLGVFYLVIWMPENKRKKKYAALLNDLKLNDEVMSKGGIIGKIVNLQEEFVILESGPDRTKIKLARNGIGSVRNSNSSDVVLEKK